MIPTIGNQSCPTDQECHTLSYYINNITLPPNVTLLFINGEHLLKTNEVLQIKGLNNVTLLGQSQWVKGFHHSVIQSRVIIKCTHTTSIAINNVYATTVVYINNLIITHCSRGIVIDSVLDAQLNDLSVQNDIEYSLLITNTATVTIDRCSFSHNGINAFLNSVKTVSISYSNFIYGCNDVSGLFIQNGDNSQGCNIKIVIIGCIFYSNVGYEVSLNSNSRNHAIIKNTIFSNNNGYYGKGLFIMITAVHSEIVMSSVKILYNAGIGAVMNDVNVGLGTFFSGGAVLLVKTKLSNIVNLQDTTFIGNNNGGLSLYLSRNGLLRTLIKHSKFVRNFGYVYGQVGGAYINMFGDGFSYDRSLHIHNTIFDSNTGVALYIKTNANIKMTDVDVVKTVNNFDSQLIQYIAALQLMCTGDIIQIVTLSNIHINNNNMTGLLLIGCQVNFNNISSIISNNKSPGNGGGIYANDNVVLSSSVPVYLINNTAGQYGGAIYSTANLLSTSVNLFTCSYFKFNVRFLNNYAGIA